MKLYLRVRLELVHWLLTAGPSDVHTVVSSWVF